jgi:hypothetical protein
MSQPIELSNVDVSKITLTRNPDVKRTTGKWFNIEYQGKRNFSIILPKMKTGIRILEFEGKKTYATNLSFEGMNELTSHGIKLKAAHTKVVAIEERIKNCIIAKQDEFFKEKKPITSAQISERVGRIMYSGVDKLTGKPYPDTFTTELDPKKPNKNDVNKTVEEIEEIKKQFKTLLNHPLLKDRKDQEIKVNADNIKDALPWGTVIVPVVTLDHIWVSTSTQKVTTKCHLVHAIVIETREAFKIDLKQYIDDDTVDTVQDELYEGEEMQVEA